MNAFLSALINGLVLSPVVVFAVWLAVRLAPRRAMNAATRYVVWYSALFVTVALPGWYAPWPRWFAPSRPHAAAGATATPATAGFDESSPMMPVEARSNTLPLPSAPLSFEAPRRTPQHRPLPVPEFPIAVAPGAWPRWMGIALASIALLMLARVAVSFLRLESRKRAAVPAAPELAARAAGWLTLLGSRRKNVRLLVSAEISCPMAAGPFHPAILIPASLARTLEPGELDQIALHEAAHLARCDDWALLFQRVAEALFAWHPAVHWISRRIELEREIACDDLVIGVTGRANSYAACLAHMAEIAGNARAPLAAAGAMTKSHLACRIEALLDKTRNKGARLLRLRAAALIAAQIALVYVAARTPKLVAFAAPLQQASAPKPAAPAQAAPEPARIVPSPAPDLASPEEWIAANAVRLTTPEAGNGFSDMQPLKKIVGDSRIVALGEATHGTREFFQLKHRMLEFLATEMGFSIFSIEANMPEAYRLNEYVLEGKGDPAQLLKGMYFWTWDTEEVLAMIKWMREFNQSGKGRLQFTGFDMQTPTVAAEIVKDFAAKYDPEYAPKIREAASSALSAQGHSFGVATATFPVKDAAGKRVKFSGYIKTENVTNGYAGLWWRVDGASREVLAFDNMQSRGVTGTTDWTRYEIDLPVDAKATNINFGALFPGQGTAWFDDLKIELDGVPYTDSSAFDLEFESPSPRGFYTGGNSYQVRLDNTTAHGGKQSLRMSRSAPASKAAGEMVPIWQGVISHLEDSESGYRAKGASARESVWAIQNARVILQCLQMRASSVSRDASMAANVKWILDQNPGAKIVLWAHNGHVSAANNGGFEPMGTVLRGIYGRQMVVFGFAFNEGSFQAIAQGKGLKKHTVPPAPAGSFDATLAAAHVPLMAIDWRQAPKTGPIADWLAKPHKSRSIGSGYPEGEPYALMTDVKAPEVFDATLFVANTTAARANAGAPAAQASNDFGAATATFPVKDAAGKRVKFSGYIKTDQVAGGNANLWWRSDKGKDVLEFRNLQDQAPSGTTSWTRYELEAFVSPDATNINFGVTFAGEGAAWFDDLQVELDGVPYTGTGAFDFGFESAKGFMLFGGRSYQSLTDATVSHSGARSLRIRRVSQEELTAMGPSRFDDPDYSGISLKLPAGSYVSGLGRWGDQETTLQLGGPQGGAESTSLWYRVLHAPDAQRRFDEAVAQKVASRASSPYFTGYAVRPGTQQSRTVNGRDAVSYVADYTANGRKMVEYLTYVYSDHVHAEFFQRGPAENLDAMRKSLDVVIATLQLP